MAAASGRKLDELAGDPIGARVTPWLLPVVAVEVDGTPEDAVAAARAAGADEIWAALPAGHPLLGGASPEPPGLEVGADGRMRRFGGRLMPLPEAERGLLSIPASSLGQSGLADRAVVLVWPDPTLGPDVVLPGVPHVGDRGIALAAGMGAARGGGFLRELPMGAYLATTAALALAFSLWLDRRTVTGSVVAAGVLLVGQVGAAFVARTNGLVWPFVGVTVALALPLVWRWAGTLSALGGTLDQLATRAGSPATERLPIGVRGLAEMVHVHLPDATVVAVERAAGGTRVPVARHGPRRASPQPVPATAGWHDGWLLVAVEAPSSRDPAGWLLISGPLPEGVEASVRAIAGSDRVEVPATTRDPYQVRVALAEQVVDTLADELAPWRDVLGNNGLAVGVFDVAGKVHASGARLVVPGEAGRAPLVSMCASRGELEEDAVLQLLAEARRLRRPARLRVDRGLAELEVRPLFRGEAHSGWFAVQLDRMSEDRRTADLFAASAQRIRGLLTELRERAGGAAQQPDSADLVGRVSVEIGAELERATAVLKAEPTEDRSRPVFLREYLEDVVARLAPAHRALVTLDVPDVPRPVALKATAFDIVVKRLVIDAAERGLHVTVLAVPDPKGVTLFFHDDSGGLPSSQGRTDHGAAARLGTDGVEVDVENAGGGRRTRMRLPYY